MWGTGCQVCWIRMARMIQRQCATCHKQGLSSQLATSAMPSWCTCVRGWALYPGGEAGWLASRQGCPKAGPSASRVSGTLQLTSQCWREASTDTWQGQVYSPELDPQWVFLPPLAPSATELALPEFPGHSNSPLFPLNPWLQPCVDHVSNWQCPSKELRAQKTEIIGWFKLIFGMSKWLRAETQLQRASGHVEKIVTLAQGITEGGRISEDPSVFCPPPSPQHRRKVVKLIPLWRLQPLHSLEPAPSPSSWKPLPLNDSTVL